MHDKHWRLATISTVADSTQSAVGLALRTLTERIAKRMIRRGFSQPSFVDVAMSKHRRRLWRRAIEVPADLIIAHHVPALAPATRAARILSARLAFDAEDLHAEDRPDTPEFALDRHLISSTERRYLPLCQRVTASAPGIADELVRRYGIARPAIVLNAFPNDAKIQSAPARRPNAPLSLYWYSQVIGLDRGLQDVLRAIPLLRRPAELHLRGAVSEEVKATLSAIAAQLGIARSLHFHPLAAPPELARLAAQHDIGLALEQPVTLNRQLCITNKLMLYFTAGIPVVATDTPGQRAIIEAAGAAGVLYAPGDHAALAQAIDTLAGSPDTLMRAKTTASELGRGLFSWERQAGKLVSYLTRDTTTAGERESAAALFA